MVAALTRRCTGDTADGILGQYSQPPVIHHNGLSAKNASAQQVPWLDRQFGSSGPAALAVSASTAQTGRDITIAEPYRQHTIELRSLPSKLTPVSLRQPGTVRRREFGGLV